MKFIVFGLGSFGATLSIQLVQLGHEVIGVDNKLETVDKYKYVITHGIALDATSKEAVEQLPLKDVDAAIIGIGESEGANILATALLKQIGVGRIICRVISPLQKMVLEAMNMNEFVHPEEYAAERLALKLDLPGVIDSFQISSDYRLLEVAVPERYIGVAVGSLDLPNRYKIIFVSIMRKIQKKNLIGLDKNELQVMGVVPPSTILKKEDVLLLFGTPISLEYFISG